MATGRDAADVAITTTFGASVLNRFTVITDEVQELPKVQAVGGTQRDDELSARI